MKFEKKFLIYSFLIIFSLLLILISIINYNEYKKEKHFLIDNIKKSLKICSYKLNCKNIKVSFEKKANNLTPFTLEKNEKTFYMLFELPQLKKHFLKLSISKDLYNKKLKKVKNKILKQFFIEFLAILLITIIFVYILLIPLKEAYKINETFIKDILHDLNTPLTTLKLNLFLLKKEFGEHDRINKIEQTIKTILKYQQNLQIFLSNNPNQIETFNIKELIDEKLKFYSANYPNIKYSNTADYKITINKNAFNSILENIISNAFKYNKKNGSIEIFLKDKKLFIKDSGIGIKNPKKIFNRFYKESQRGTGIGMNIVKKLCDELKIDIKIESQKEKGTTVILDLKRYC
ncbi:hypothetical protein JCM11957_02820 [Caminibacter profundus]